ncbi:MAG: Fe-S cluster assembly protein SufD [bacterium JZ-2024 1]
MSQSPTIAKENIVPVTPTDGEPGWLTELRARGLDYFRRLGPPSSRYFSFARYPLSVLRQLPERSEGAPGIPEDALMVFVDHTAYTAPSVPAGLTLQSFHEFMADPRSESLFLKDIVNLEENGLTGLHGALVQSGAFITVRRGVALADPVRIQFRYRDGGLAFATHTFIHLHEGSQLTLVEEFTPNDPAHDPAEPVYHSHIVEVLLDPNAVLHYAALEDAPPNVYLFRRRAARILRESQMLWTLSWMGSEMTHSGVRTDLSGDGSFAFDLQVFFLVRSQQLDLWSTMNHRARHTKAEVLAKGVLRDRSRSVFNGMLRILPEGNTSDSYQASHTILLNPGARADAIPGLEILANDVRCTHSATTGPIDEDQLFYIRSRGISEEFAKKLIVEGFLEPAFGRVPIASVREAIRHSFNKKWFSRSPGNR